VSAGTRVPPVLQFRIMPRRVASCFFVALAITAGMAADQPLRLEPEVASQNLVKQVDPTVPQLAKTMEIGGTVVVDVTISIEGKVSAEKVISGHPILMMAFLEALKKWEYKPFLRDGKPVTVITRVEWTFPSIPRTSTEEKAMHDYYPAFQECYALVHAQKNAEAERKCSEAVKLADQLPANRISERGSSRTFLAHALFHQRRFDEAIPLYQKALEIRASLEDQDRDADFAGTNANLARAYFVTGQLDKAEPLYARAITVYEAAIVALPDMKDHYVPRLKDTLLEYAKLKVARGEADRAHDLEQKAAGLH
jgi:TonB family protein